MIELRSVLSALLLGAALTTSAFAIPTVPQARLSFTGGDSSKLSITLETPIQVQFNSAFNGNVGFFLFFADLTSKKVEVPVSGDIGVKFNGNHIFDVNNVYSHNLMGGSQYDLGLFNFDTGGLNLNFVPGDVLEYSAGTVVTWTNQYISGGIADGYFDVFFFSNQADPVDVTITVVPEPSTYALISGGVVLAGVMIRRRQQRSKAA